MTPRWYPVAFSFFLLPLVLSTQSFSAPGSDRAASTKVDADHLEHDDKLRVTRFSGQVVLTKGSLVLKGDRLELKQLPDGSNLGHLKGNPALMRQRRQAEGEWIHGQADTIDYNSATEVAVLSGNAVLRRMVGEIERDRVAGDKVTYNSVTEVYQVEAGARGTRARMTVVPIPGAER